MPHCIALYLNSLQVSSAAYKDYNCSRRSWTESISSSNPSKVGARRSSTSPSLTNPDQYVVCDSASVNDVRLKVAHSHLIHPDHCIPVFDYVIISADQPFWLSAHFLRSPPGFIGQ